MNKLFLDIGNSCIKYSTVTNGDYNIHNSILLDDLLLNGLDSFGFPYFPDTVYFSTVADADKVDALKLLIQNEWQVFPIQLTAQKSCCGLTSGYDNFNQLGVDRWFAMQGAIGIYDIPIIVVDAGTALTIDAVVDGQHLGGLIVPGMNTMRQSLATNTADLLDVRTSDIKSDSNELLLLGTNTASAILAGTLYMAASFINQVINDLNNQVGTQFKIIMTGGESEQLCRLLDFEYDYIPDLVLQGMVNVEESVKNS
ncbi:type III pantothenate kinase [Thiomicrorhabdus lithotrophica]|uniref:Type III pantothenate kinase n=1 Tax=Thiomicrorhabdus lithotrophica TaxID=2949997 RepID=A0ABY8C8X2_9GAMM|nr:type III pantothenate kinase [Thiomicrorhabdus lithotrophica]WEJ62423.1 type III pantothenate kinase [Thiomicrorhabdus lithotrophica]